MIKLKAINLVKVFVDVSRNVVRELGSMVKNNVDMEGGRYPRLKKTLNSASQKKQLSRSMIGGRKISKVERKKIKEAVKFRETRMFDKGYFARNAFEFKVEGSKDVPYSRIFLSNKKHYSATYQDTGRWNMGENENIRRSMGKMLWLFPQSEAHLDNLQSWKKGSNTIKEEAVRQITENLKVKIQKTILI